jgi:hypothetical protein
MRSRQPRRPLSAALPGTLVVALLAAAAPLAAQIIEGTVVEDESRLPIPGAEVLLLEETGERETRAQTVTDSLGAFRLTVPAPGRYTLLLRRLGYATRSTAAFEAARAEVIVTEVALSTEALELVPLVVVERRRERNVLLARFHQRAEHTRRSGFGRVYYRDELARFGSVRGLYLMQLGSRRCQITILVDGLPVSDPNELDFLADLERVEGVEIYRSQFQFPPEYLHHRACALMLVWTRPEVGRPFSLKRLLIGGGLAVLLFFVVR